MGLRILGKGPELFPLPNNETIVASGILFGMFKVKARPGNICFSRSSLGFQNVKGTSVICMSV